MLDIPFVANLPGKLKKLKNLAQLWLHLKKKYLKIIILKTIFVTP
jgi:hypothetical protein